jgi:hypothetical protein
MSDDTDKLRAELEAARAENNALRSALIAMCDTYSANRAEKLKVKAYRSVASHGASPFSLETVEAHVRFLEGKEREVADVLEEVLSRVDVYEESYSHPTPAEIAEWRKVLR